MDMQYKMKNGILVSYKTSQSSPIWKFLLVLILMSASGAGAFFYTQKFFIPIAANNSPAPIVNLDSINEIQDSLQKIAKEEVEVNVKNYSFNVETLVKIMNKVFPKQKMTDKDKESFAKAALKWGSHYSIPPLLILSIAYRESLFDPKVVSSANARGPMQVIYKYHKDRLDKIGKKEKDLHEIDTGIRIGTEVFRTFYNHHKQDIFKAMNSYVGAARRDYSDDIINKYFQANIYFEEQKTKEK